VERKKERNKVEEEALLEERKKSKRRRRKETTNGNLRSQIRRQRQNQEPQDVEKILKTEEDKKRKDETVKRKSVYDLEKQKEHWAAHVRRQIAHLEQSSSRSTGSKKIEKKNAKNRFGPKILGTAEMQNL
jgi:hypothetical protein